LGNARTSRRRPRTVASTRTTVIKPLFVQGPSPTARLFLALALALALIVADHRFRHLDALRSALTVVAYPILYAASLPASLSAEVRARLATEATLRAENKVLHRDNLALLGRLQQFDALEAENQRLRDLLGSSFKIGDRVLVAEILGVDLNPYRQQVVIDKGSASGVFVGQPVLDANAVMGQVVRVDPLTATVLLITDADHSLPVRVSRNGLRALASGTGVINRLELPHLTNNADVRVGDQLFTSGLGGRFPAGYPVARVVEVRIEPGKPFATVIAEPNAGLDRAREVLLVWTLPGSAAEVTLGDAATGAGQHLQGHP
jgi:rod shape-determining protein MreC